jgi:nicotinate-nucleotide pyrophosphorylase (carboxylating)
MQHTEFSDNYEIKQLIAQALNEDIRTGDVSSLSSIPVDKTNTAKLIVKEDGIIAGIALAGVVALMTDERLSIEYLKKDGDAVRKGDIAFRITGPTHSLLKAERLILNFMQRLSGIATTANRYAKAVEGTGCMILDTRKTTPGLRMLEKWAVKTGGAFNHRTGLYDMIMLKDNHIDAAGGIAAAVEKAHQYRMEKNPGLKIEVETRNLDEVQQAMNARHVNRIMLDNFFPEMVKQAVELIGGKFETEASGGITLENIRAYAETGVDFISVGALTHSVKSLDLSLKIEK